VKTGPTTKINRGIMKKILSIIILSIASVSMIWAQADCASAIDVTGSLTATCNTISNVDVFAGLLSAEGCEPGASQGGTDDAIWFTFTAPFDGFADITNTDDPLIPDTDLSALDMCGATVCIGQNDDGGNTYTSALMGLPITAGQSVYLQWVEVYQLLLELLTQ